MGRRGRWEGSGAQNFIYVVYFVFRVRMRSQSLLVKAVKPRRMLPLVHPSRKPKRSLLLVVREDRLQELGVAESAIYSHYSMLHLYWIVWEEGEGRSLVPLLGGAKSTITVDPQTFGMLT